MTEVRMPQLGETVTEGTVLRWLKSVGDEVVEGEMLFEVSTDKVETEVPSPGSGTLVDIIVGEGETVEVGAVLATVTNPTDPAPSGPHEAPAAGTTVASAPVRSEGQDPPSSRPLLSPVVRRLARSAGIDLDTVTGTGPGGRIQRRDVEEAIAAGAADKDPTPAHQPVARRPADETPPPNPTSRTSRPSRTLAHSRIRRATAQHMRRSLDTSAHVYASIDVDFDAVDRVRRRHKESFAAAEGVGLTYLPFIARAVIDAITDYPIVNAHWGDEELLIFDEVNLGIAVDVNFEGLMVPVIRGADGLRLRALARSIAHHADRARSSSLSPDDLAGGSFTITNPGPFGTSFTLPIINQPQLAILSTDAVQRRPVVIRTPSGDEAIAIHPTGKLSLGWDHRAFDGAYAAAFLNRIKTLLESNDWDRELGPGAPH